jgi:hypothetical protein
VSAWTLRKSKTLPRTSQKNGKGQADECGQMPHRTILMDCGGVGKVMGRGLNQLIKTPVNLQNRNPGFLPFFDV